MKLNCVQTWRKFYKLHHLTSCYSLEHVLHPCYLHNHNQPLRSLTTQFDRFNNALQDCIAAVDLRKGRSVHAQLIRFHPNASTSMWNKLLSLYNNCKQTHNCLQLFDKMSERDVVSFNIIISMHIRNFCDGVEALRLYIRMQEEGVMPNHITFCTLVGACAELTASHLIELIHAQLIQYGLNSNAFVGSALVDAYSKRMRLQEAILAFDEIAELDLVSWNIMIDGCVRNGGKEHALRMFTRMHHDGVLFDSFTLSSITKTCSEPKDLEWGMQLHCCMVKAGLSCETPISNALITMYSKCEDWMPSAFKIFEKIPAPNIISWTSMIAGFMQNGQSKEAVDFYHRMLRVGVKENEFSFASILPAYTSLASIEQGMQVHARIIKSSFGVDVSVGNALIDMYSKCGSLTDARLVFTTMERRDVVSWTVMITGLGLHGKGKEALEVLKEMISEGMRPDAVTFLGGLSACSHGGHVDEGLQIFRSMINVYGVKPRRQHYACVVDMLGRAGKLMEAEKFIAEMGIGSDPLVWEAMLGGCRIHGEMALGERSAEKIMELEPKKDGPYVVLANIYADRGLWEVKGKVRERLGVGGLKKEAGCSWFAVQHAG